ncbi:MAG: segregation and condensation protein A [Pseudomonadota bacterium]
MSDKKKNSDALSVEQRTLVVFRQVLAKVVREITPSPGMRHPLSDETIEDIKQCFGLIAAREREIQDMMGNKTTGKPIYPGDQPKLQEVDFDPTLPTKAK